MLRHYEPIPHHKRMKILRGPSSETRRGVFDEAIQFLKQKTHLRQGYGVAKLSLRQGYGVARQDSGLPRMITSSQRRALQGSRQKGTDPLILVSPSPLPPSLRGVFDEAIQSSRSRATGPVTSFTNDGDQKEQKLKILRGPSSETRCSLGAGWRFSVP